MHACARLREEGHKWASHPWPVHSLHGICAASWASSAVTCPSAACRMRAARRWPPCKTSSAPTPPYIWPGARLDQGSRWTASALDRALPPPTSGQLGGQDCGRPPSCTASSLPVCLAAGGRYCAASCVAVMLRPSCPTSSSCTSPRTCRCVHLWMCVRAAPQESAVATYARTARARVCVRACACVSV